MDITTFTYLTVTSLIFAVIAVVLSIFLFIKGSKKNVMSHAGQEASDIVPVVEEFMRRLRKMEENVVEQRVRSEILDLHVRREIARIDVEERESKKKGSVDVNVRGLRHESNEWQVENAAVSPENAIAENRRRVATTEKVVLETVKEFEGRATAKDIQKRIGKSREHTARMMNSLFRQALVERNVSIRPFSYSITEKGREFLGL